ncbi:MULTISPECIES: hypothetical protein [Streptococcus]|uniref:hypothetical protein n=1 Tax=Streptococcus TaxID=1301 RepID=UPI0011DCEA4E|nr:MULTISPECIES: hypothetical protein [Streptococcus]NKN40606.1 hypothetical protein [Streptococcus alactolyticus]NKN85330.1 hypothetical protein [Streptococcus agalactiae]
MAGRKNQKSSTQKRDLKQETTWKNNLFARYILFRYSLALLFFANIYWIMILSYQLNVIIILPILQLLLIAIAFAEQFTLYGKITVALKWTKLAFLGQIAVSLIGILLVILPYQFEQAFPIFSNGLSGKVFVIVLQLLGLGLSQLNIKRIEQVKNNTDKFYYRFQQTFGK